MYTSAFSTRFAPQVSISTLNYIFKEIGNPDLLCVYTEDFVLSFKLRKITMTANMTIYKSSLKTIKRLKVISFKIICTLEIIHPYNLHRYLSSVVKIILLVLPKVWIIHIKPRMCSLITTKQLLEHTERYAALGYQPVPALG